MTATAPIPPSGRRWYMIFTLNGRPVTPPEALAAVEKGATFADLDKAEAAVTRLAESARPPYAPMRRDLDSNCFPHEPRR